MISAGRCSECCKLHESRDAFCCISRADAATPPAFAALPEAEGDSRVPQDLDSLGCRRHVRPLGHEGAAVAHQRRRPAPSSSFSVAHGRATSHGTSQIVPAWTCRACGTHSAYDVRGALYLLDLAQQLDVDPTFLSSRTSSPEHHFHQDRLPDEVSPFLRRPSPTGSRAAVALWRSPQIRHAVPPRIPLPAEADWLARAGRRRAHLGTLGVRT